MPLGASCLTLILLTRTLASACSVLQLIGCVLRSSHLWNGLRFARNASSSTVSTRTTKRASLIFLAASSASSTQTLRASLPSRVSYRGVKQPSSSVSSPFCSSSLVSPRSCAFISLSLGRLSRFRRPTFFFGSIWRKRRARGAKYHEVKVLNDGDELPLSHHHYRDSSRSEMSRDSEPEHNHSPDIAPYVPEEHR